MGFVDWLKRILGCREGELQAEIDALVDQLHALQAKYDTDCQYYESRIQTLNNLIAKAVTFTDLSDFNGKVNEVNPANYIHVSDYNQADAVYYELDYNDWILALGRIFKSFKATWTTEIFDCDDFALLFSALLAYSVYKSGFKQQFALGIAWSTSHAYNCFVDKSNNVWIYEPQTNTVIGKLGATNPPYNTQEVWFMS